MLVGKTCTKYTHTYNKHISGCLYTYNTLLPCDMSCPTNSNVCVLCPMTIPQWAATDHELTERPRTREREAWGRYRRIVFHSSIRSELQAEGRKGLAHFPLKTFLNNMPPWRPHTPPLLSYNNNTDNCVLENYMLATAYVSHLSQHCYEVLLCSPLYTCTSKATQTEQSQNLNPCSCRLWGRRVGHEWRNSAAAAAVQLDSPWPQRYTKLQLLFPQD